MTTTMINGLLPGLDVSAGSRLPALRAAKMPVDTVAAGSVPAGLHFSLCGDAAAVRVEVRRGDATSVPCPGQSGELAVWVDDQFVADAPLDGGAATIELPARSTDSIVRIYIPEEFEILSASATPLQGALCAPAQRAHVVAYGDSITQGWTVSRTGASWPAVLERMSGWDVANLGFAGSARGETQAALAIADVAPDAVIIAWGTNAWASAPTDPGLIAETNRLFLRTIRAACPDAPIVVLSPLLRPDAEESRNVYGATLADLRRAMEQSVVDFIARNDDHRLALIPGEPVLRADDLVDGVHPGDVGHAKIATAVRDALAPMLTLDQGGSV